MSYDAWKTRVADSEQEPDPDDPVTCPHCAASEDEPHSWLCPLEEPRCDVCRRDLAADEDGRCGDCRSLAAECEADQRGAA